MKVIFLKNHLANKKDDEKELDEAAGTYLVRAGVCEPVKEKKEIPVAKEKVEIKKVKEKKEI